MLNRKDDQIASLVDQLQAANDQIKELQKKLTFLQSPERRGLHGTVIEFISDI
jgi:hypothetical protein